MPQLIDHVRVLTDEIGPRPATTDSEQRAAQWLARTFGERGLDTEVQEFMSPRTYSWAYVIYNLLTIAAALFSGFMGILIWPAFAVSALVAVSFLSELDTRAGLTRLMPKGPSQNVIARHVPRARRGERLRKVVVVAHYDSARSSLAFSPGAVGGFPLTFALMKWVTALVPVLIFVAALPVSKPLDPWLWYATMAVAAYLIIPLVINVHRELAMPFVAGANDNASGVAAMLGVMEALVPNPDASSLTMSSGFHPVRHGYEAAHDAAVVPEGAELHYTPAETPSGDSGALPDDFSWASEVDERPERGQAMMEFETIEFDVIGESSLGRDHADQAAPAAPMSAPTLDDLPEFDSADVEQPAPEPESEPRKKRGLFDRLKRRSRERKNAEDISNWLGVDDSFDARKAGKDIGSWDNFGGDDDDEGFGWKGGRAGDDPIGDPDFAATTAARIRRKVTETVDRDLTEKEVWFVATGAEEVGTYGMQAFLHEYGEDLKDALIINIDGCGVGQLYWASAEGMVRRYHGDRRIISIARKVSRETETLIKPKVYKGLSTDATPALARGFKALSIMAFDKKGLPANWHWKTDTADSLDPELIEKTAEFVTAMVREA